MSCKMERKDSAYTPVINGNPSHFIRRQRFFNSQKFKFEYVFGLLHLHFALFSTKPTYECSLQLEKMSPIVRQKSIIAQR